MESRVRLVPLFTTFVLAAAPGTPAQTADGTPNSALLPCGLRNPVPGGIFAGHPEGTGLDLADSPRPVHAVLGVTLDYAEWGHTRWKSPKDTAFSVRVKLEKPIPWRDRHVTHLYYTHLSSLTLERAESDDSEIRIRGGQRLGTSGTANGSPHLHLGFLLDGNVEQDSWDGLLSDAQIPELFGRARNGTSLPKN
ncbi:MAG: hypothetical protein U0169_11605 [Polyangiaceae bacterium]